MATVGSIVIGMSAKTSQLKADLDKGAAAVARFASKAAKASFEVAANLGEIATKGAVDAVGGLGAFALAQANLIDQAGDAADRLGTTTSNLLALRYAAKLTGSEAESLDAAIAKMNANLGDAATKGGPAADALAALGLDARQLAAVDPAEAFQRIVAGFEKIPNPAQRAALAMDIFGKGGIALLGTIKAGPAEVARLAAEFQSIGGITESTRGQIGAMFDSFDRLGLLISAVGGKFAGELAPYVVAAGEYLVELGKQGIDAGGLVTTAVEGMLTGVAGIADAFDFAKSSFSSMQVLVIRGFAAIVKGVGYVLGGLSYLANQTLQLETTWGTSLKNMADNLRELAAEQEASASTSPGQSAGDKVRATFDEIRKGAAKSQAAVSGMNKGIVDIAPALKTAQDEAKKTFELMKSDAAKFTEEATTPLERFQAEQSKLAQLLKAGLVSQQTVDRLTAKGKTDLASGATDKAPQRAAALELGSKEARSAALDFQGRKADAEPAKRTAENTAKAVDLQTQANALLSQVVGAIRAKVAPAVETII